MKQLAYIFDIDGTLADCTHRLHFLKPPAGTIHFNLDEVDWKPDWNAFHAACVDDKPIEDVCRVCRSVSYDTTCIFLTGRPEKCRQHTFDWLKDNDLPLNDRDILLMRKDGDHRPDYEVKREIYEQEIKDQYNIVGVFEDRQQCVDMWRSLGLTCFQVAKGDY